MGTYHQISFKHLARYVRELVWCHNHKSLSSIDRMEFIVQSLDRRELRYRDLIGAER